MREAVHVSWLDGCHDGQHGVGRQVGHSRHLGQVTEAFPDRRRRLRRHVDLLLRSLHPRVGVAHPSCCAHSGSCSEGSPLVFVLSILPGRPRAPTRAWAAQSRQKLGPGPMFIQTPPPPLGAWLFGGGSPVGGRRRHSSSMQREDAPVDRLACIRTVPNGRLSFPPSCYLGPAIHIICVRMSLARSVFFPSRRALSECLARLQGYTWYMSLPFGLFTSVKPRDMLQRPTDGPSNCSFWNFRIFFQDASRS